MIGSGMEWTSNVYPRPIRLTGQVKSVPLGLGPIGYPWVVLKLPSLFSSHPCMSCKS